MVWQSGVPSSNLSCSSPPPGGVHSSVTSSWFSHFTEQTMNGLTSHVTVKCYPERSFETNGFWRCLHPKTFLVRHLSITVSRHRQWLFSESNLNPMRVPLDTALACRGANVFKGPVGFCFSQLQNELTIGPRLNAGVYGWLAVCVCVLPILNLVLIHMCQSAWEIIQIFFYDSWNVSAKLIRITHFALSWNRWTDKDWNLRVERKWIRKNEKEWRKKGVFIAYASRLNNDYQHCLSFLSCLIGESLCQKPSKASEGTLVCCRTQNGISLISEISSETEIHGRERNKCYRTLQTQYGRQAWHRRDLTWNAACLEAIQLSLMH